MEIENRNKIVSVVLAIIIIVLGYILYQSIVGPYKIVHKQKIMTQRVRYRMGHVRDALIQYQNLKGEFPPTKGGLDSLVSFLRVDSLKSDSLQADTSMQLDSLMIAKRDSMLNSYHSSNKISADSLVFSPRPPHKKFEYKRNANLNPSIYLLKDPDSPDQIGSTSRTTMLNAASWE